MQQLLPVVDSICKHPEYFVDDASQGPPLLAVATKSLYCLTKKHEPKKTSALDNLLIDGFEQEQIWAQLQLLNIPILHHVDKQVNAMLKRYEYDQNGAANKHKANGNFLAQKVAADSGDYIEEHVEEEDVDEEDLGLEEDVGDANGQDTDNMEVDSKHSDISDSEATDQSMDDLDNVDTHGGNGNSGKEQFSLDDLDAFAEQDLEADEELEDLLNHPYDNSTTQSDKNKWVLESSDDDTDASANSEQEGLNENDTQNHETAFGTSESAVAKSRYEAEMNEMKRKISALEDAAVVPKSWTMVGEVSLRDRPTNSLLAEDLFFDYSSKPPPVITQERTASLEDIIKQRITKGTWDDVERKKEHVIEHKPVIELDSSKNTEGLAAVYEKQYRNTVGTLTSGGLRPGTATVSKQEELLETFRALCTKLDALSHFHYTPLAPRGEAHVKASAAPALSKEEATPTAVSDTSLIAPQELLSAPRSLKDKDELSKQENKAHRRHRKEAAKKEKQHTAPKGTPISAADALKKLNKNKVTVIDSSMPTKHLSSSKFFKIIQDQEKQGSLPKNPTTKNSKVFKL